MLFFKRLFFELFFFVLWRRTTPRSSFIPVQQKNVLTGWTKIGSNILILFVVIGFFNKAFAINNSEKLYFNIPKQWAFSSLISFAKQADITFMFPMNKIENIKTNAVTGKYTITDALSLLLEGTSLEVNSDEKGQISILLDQRFERDKMFNNKKNKVTGAVLAVLSSMSSGQALAEETSKNTTKKSEEVEVITVSGIRQSLTDLL